MGERPASKVRAHRKEESVARVDKIEKWLGLPWARGYEVSSFGRVRTYRDLQGVWRSKPRQISTRANCQGYCHIGFTGTNGKRIYKRVHVLVLEAFRGFPPKGMVGRHLDGDKSNCRLGNLAWGTPQENTDDAKRHGAIARGVRLPTAKLTDDKVREAIRLTELGHTNVEIGKRFHVHPSLICRVVNRKRWAHVA